MARPAPSTTIVRAAKSEALLAVRLYNDPAAERSLEAFGVHMHLAWLYLLQAKFLRENRDIRYPDPQHRGWFQRIDGEHRTWELERCVKERWIDPNDPIRANLEFFIKFRNKTEHRYKGRDTALFAAISDKSQALLLNFEEELTAQFGAEHSLAEKLRFPVFIGTFTEPAEQAMRRLNKSLPAELRKFIADYDAAIDDTTLSDSRYSFRLKVYLQPAQRDNTDMAIRFVRADDLTSDQALKLGDVGKTGTVIVRSQRVSVSNDGLLKYMEVVNGVQKAIPFIFGTDHLKRALRNENVRSGKGTANPERTRSDFCRYDKLHDSYAYTPAYVNHLIKECSTREGFKQVTGRNPEARLRLQGDIETANIQTAL
jgi:hypothetical protein